MTDIVDQIKSAKAATVKMSVLSTDVKNNALSKMADALEKNRGYIMEENKKDLDDVRDKIPKPMYKRMVVDDAKIDDMIMGVKSVRSMI